ncbi:hypothetical protein FB451DRAFT_1194711 [Mycena latifolia]|nr:hypothetical protein FB451DRAFT_1194711 [Mycena latifolia]
MLRTTVRCLSAQFKPSGNFIQPTLMQQLPFSLPERCLKHLERRNRDAASSVIEAAIVSPRNRHFRDLPGSRQVDFVDFFSPEPEQLLTKYYARFPPTGTSLQNRKLSILEFSRWVELDELGNHDDHEAASTAHASHMRDVHSVTEGERGRRARGRKGKGTERLAPRRAGVEGTLESRRMKRPSPRYSSFSTESSLSTILQRGWCRKSANILAQYYWGPTTEKTDISEGSTSSNASGIVPLLNGCFMSTLELQMPLAIQTPVGKQAGKRHRNGWIGCI